MQVQNMPNNTLSKWKCTLANISDHHIGWCSFCCVNTCKSQLAVSLVHYGTVVTATVIWEERPSAFNIVI